MRQKTITWWTNRVKAHCSQDTIRLSAIVALCMAAYKQGYVSGYTRAKKSSS